MWVHRKTEVNLLSGYSLNRIKASLIDLWIWLKLDLSKAKEDPKDYPPNMWILEFDTRVIKTTKNIFWI